MNNAHKEDGQNIEAGGTPPSAPQPAGAVGDWADEAATWRSTLGIEIEAAMKGRGLSQSDLAEKMGVSRQYISRVVAGSENLSIETLAKFTNALDLTLTIKLARVESGNCPECGGVKPWCLLRDRIQNYFGNGGLFNPEMMEHNKVSALLMEILDAIDNAGLARPTHAPQLPAAGTQATTRTLREAIYTALGSTPFHVTKWERDAQTDAVLTALALTAGKGGGA